ncbi:Leucine-rich repeat-containing protein 23 [Chytridiales sp. JEL 0842]|nr:Leucine-rich repeat-containing protein 23 [Chytridiales sp. JEL 0842]
MADIEETPAPIPDSTAEEESIKPTDPDSQPAEDSTPTPSSTKLTQDLLAQHISLLARTGNGLSHAYTRLELTGKNLGNIDLLESYVHLRYLDLSDNSIRDIDPLASLEYLLSVNFQSNKIQTIPASLDRRKYLQQANFSKNMIKSINVQSWPMCAWLNLNENKLTELKLQEFGELVHLEARSNKITNMHGINARKLERLYLGANNITSLDLADKPALQTLNLRDNKVSTVGEVNEGLKALNYINLRNNKVESIDEIAKLAILPSLKTLVLMERLDKEPIMDDEREDAAALVGNYASVMQEPAGVEDPVPEE